MTSLEIIGKVLFKVAVLEDTHGVVLSQAHFSLGILTVDAYVSTHELYAPEFDLLTSKGEIYICCSTCSLRRSSWLLMRGAMLPFAPGVAAIGSVSGISSATLSLAGEVFGVAAVLPPNAVSPVFVKIDPLCVSPCDVVAEPTDGRFQLAVHSRAPR